MAGRKSSDNSDTNSGSGFPLLSVSYGLLLLAIAGFVGWIYWLNLANPAGQEVAEVTDELTPVTLAPKKEEAATEEKPVLEEPPAKTDVEAETENKTDVETAEKAPEPKEETKPDATEVSEIAEPSEPIETDIKQEEKDTSLPVASDETAEPEKNKPVEEEKAETKEPVVAEENVSVEEDETPPDPEKLAPKEEVLALAPAPVPELTKKSDFGLLPTVGPSGKKPWRVYARPFDDPLDRPRIAIVMSEMGMSKSATQIAIQSLPGPVTLSFNPYARDIQSWIDQSRAAGHEVLLQLPMEPFGYPNNDPGPHSLLTSLTDRENLNRLDWMLARFTGYSGVTNQMGSRFTSSSEDLQPILNVLNQRGLLYLDGRTSAKSVAGREASRLGMPVAINNRFLDQKADRVAIDTRLSELERIARYTGTAVGVGYPYPVTMERISAWAKTLNRKGFVLAPVSAVINRQEIQ